MCRRGACLRRCHRCARPLARSWCQLVQKAEKYIYNLKSLPDFKNLQIRHIIKS